MRSEIPALKNEVVCPNCDGHGCSMCEGHGHVHRGAALFYKDIVEAGLLTDEEDNSLPSELVDIKEL